jgi:saccharopine dehydrogenase (NAD+, L-lysine forming)
MVLGIGGVGSVIGQKLHEFDCFDRIVLADMDTTFAQHLAARTPKNRFIVVQANAMDTASLAALMKEHNVVVTCNACNCHTNHSILEACLKAGSHYLDMAADIYSPPGVKRPGKNSFEAEIEKFNDAYLERGLLGLLCMGMDPGAVNVFARWAMDRLDTASSIRVLDADNAEVKGYRFAALFSPETLFEELNAVPYFVREGKITAGKPLETEVSWHRFPDPIGLVKTYAVAHEEGVSLGIYPPFVEKGVKYSVFKYAISDTAVNLARSIDLLQLDTWKKIKVDGVEVAPIRVATAKLPKPAQIFLCWHRGAGHAGSQAGRVLHLHDGQPPRHLREIRLLAHRRADGRPAGPSGQAHCHRENSRTRRHDARSVGPRGIDEQLHPGGPAHLRRKTRGRTHLMKPFFVAGRWETGREECPVANPWNGDPLEPVSLADAIQVETAVASAHAAFTTTRALAAWQRAETLTRIADLLHTRRREVVDCIVAEAGKPVTFAEAEADRARFTFLFAAQQALADEGHGLRMDASPPGAGHFGMVQRFPVGVILGITPFNFPLNLVAHKVAPCLATGNTMVLKPALKTPHTALLLAAILEEAGVPAGQINTVPFDHVHIPALLKDSRIKMLSFTGSAAVGWKLKGEATRLKVALELGGNAAVIVEPDTDWAAAVPKIAAGAFGFAGQSCISVQRILVHRSIYAEFRETLVRQITEKIPVGDPTRAETVVGPMISRAARDKVVGWITEAQSRGASLLTPLVTDDPGLLGPVLLENAPPNCAVVAEEAFAPLAVLDPYDTFEEAMARVNTSAYGLQAGVFTKNLSHALRAFETLEVGGVLINQVPTFRVENMPYGGVKDSGFGREGLRYAMEEMTELRSLIVKLD